MPMGEMPVLDVDGQKLHQSVSICRWLAKKVGLDGKTDFENFEIDSVADTIADLRMSKCFRESFLSTSLLIQLSYCSTRNFNGLLRT